MDINLHANDPKTLFDIIYLHETDLFCGYARRERLENFSPSALSSAKGSSVQQRLPPNKNDQAL